jgi:hypothetical protein
VKSRSFIARASAKTLAKNGGKMFSTVKRSTEPIPQMNVEATKKRRARNAKRMRGKEYQEARAGAIVRSGGRCEFTETRSYGFGSALQRFEDRCEYEGRLQFHEEHYARGRILTAADGKMYCPSHHRLAESQKPWKQHRRGF